MTENIEQDGILKIHDLRPAAGSNKAKTRVGRGEGSKGKTAGRGTKGTKARYQVPLGFEGGQAPMIRRLPKLRGFKNPNRVEFDIVNLQSLAEFFPEGGEITQEMLVAARLVRRNRLVKVLGQGELTKPITITADKFSQSAVDKITAAGGTATVRSAAADK